MSMTRVMSSSRPITPHKDFISDEEYLVSTAKKLKDHDPSSAKAWMLTAKSIFSNNFAIQYEAYSMACESGNIKEAALCLEEIITNFSEEPSLWTEMQKIAESLKSEAKDKDTLRLRELFHHLPIEIQHGLLVTVADHSDDTMEHCQLMLLLLNMFPQKIGLHGVKLIETLFSAEKHGHCQSPVNSYRQLLVTEVLPLILKSKDTTIPPKQVYRLLQKSIEFYVGFACQSSAKKNTVMQEGELSSIDSLHHLEPWPCLFSLMESAAVQLGWELTDLFNSSNSDEGRWQRIATLIQKYGSQPTVSVFDGDEEALSSYNRQVFFCTLLVFLHSLYNFGKSLNPDWFSTTQGANGSVQFLLVERPVEVQPLESTSELPTKHKKRKLENELKETLVSISVSQDATQELSITLKQSFVVAAKCWSLLQNQTTLKKELNRLIQHLQVDSWPWFQEFFINSLIYQGLHQEAIHHIMQLQKKDEKQNETSMRLSLQLGSSFWAVGNVSTACDCFLGVICSFPDENAFSSSITNSLLSKPVKKPGRCLHFLKCSSLEILDFCIGMLTTCFKERALHSSVKEDIVLGHLLVLTQYSWPLQEEVFLQLIDSIKLQTSFTYRLFYNYIINADILEEFMFLTTPTGGNVSLNILASPSSNISKQRAVTRGVNRGAKEDLRVSMERQMSRCNESLEQLLVSFFKNERELLKQNFF